MITKRPPAAPPMHVRERMIKDLIKRDPDDDETRATMIDMIKEGHVVYNKSNDTFTLTQEGLLTDPAEGNA